MAWILFNEAALTLHISERHLFRMMRQNKLMTQKNSDGKTEIWIEEEQPTADGQQPTVGSGILDLPLIPSDKMTDDLLNEVNAMLESISAQLNIGETEKRIETMYSLPAGTQRRRKKSLRELYGLASTQSLHPLVNHPQIRQALASIIVRKSPSNAGKLRSARNLLVIKNTGEYLSAEQFLIQHYAFPSHNAKSCYLALVDACREKHVLLESVAPNSSSENAHDIASMDDLPSMWSVIKFLSSRAKNDVALKRSRMSREQRVADAIKILRPDNEYRPGGLLEGDHTECVTAIYRNDGKISPLWCTKLVCVATGLIKGYELSSRPNSNTIALAFRNACLGTQLFVKTTIGFQPANIVDVCNTLRYDNGKDYKSGYTGETIGKIDFNDEARNAVRMLCEISHTGKRHPQAKGTVEGSFAIDQKIEKYLPGHKGSNYSKKPDSLAQEIKANGLLTEDEFRQAFQMIVNTINNRPRKSLGGMSPIQFYLSNQSQMRYVDEKSLNFLQLKWSGARRDGRGVPIKNGYVTMMGGKYFSMDLDGYNKQCAHLYYDPANIGRVAVYIEGEFITFAVDKELLGASEKDWLGVMKERTRRNRDVAEEIRSLRNGITLEEAKAMLFRAEINNTSVVDAALLQQRTPIVVELTGIESQARKFHDELAKQETREENEKKRQTRIKHNPLSLINVEKLR